MEETGLAIEIVSFPMKNDGSFHNYVNVYQRVWGLTSTFFWLDQKKMVAAMEKHFGGHVCRSQVLGSMVKPHKKQQWWMI